MLFVRILNRLLAACNQGNEFVIPLRRKVKSLPLKLQICFIKILEVQLTPLEHSVLNLYLSITRSVLKMMNK